MDFNGKEDSVESMFGPEIKLQTINEWAKRKGYFILDPDGFDRKDPHLFKRLFTEEEFNKGFFHCTIMGYDQAVKEGYIHGSDNS